MPSRSVQDVAPCMRSLSQWGATWALSQHIIIFEPILPAHSTTVGNEFRRPNRKEVKSDTATCEILVAWQGSAQLKAWKKHTS